MKRILTGGALGLLVLLAAVRVASRGWGAVRAGDDPPGSASESAAEETSLVRLRATPAAWLGRPVRFTVQFHALVETWNPFHTRFGTEEWLGFTGWADERFTWDEEVYDDPAPRLFVARRSLAAAALAAARTQDRFLVEAVVREVFLGEPWIEVLSLRPLAERVPEGTILHVNRGRAFLEEDRPQLARDQFARALAGPLPAAARAEIERLVALCGPPPDGE